MTFATSSCFSSGAETMMSRPASSPAMRTGASRPLWGRAPPVGRPRLAAVIAARLEKTSFRAVTVGATSACFSGYIRTDRVSGWDWSSSSTIFSTSFITSDGAEAITEFVSRLEVMLTAVAGSTFVTPSTPRSSIIWRTQSARRCCGVGVLLLDDDGRGVGVRADRAARANSSFRLEATSTASVFLSVKIRTSLRTMASWSRAFTRGTMISKSVGLARTTTLRVRTSGTTVTCGLGSWICWGCCGRAPLPRRDG